MTSWLADTAFTISLSAGCFVNDKVAAGKYRVGEK